MKDHPLLFTTENVRAILDGRKIQTRRVPVERYKNWKVGDTIWGRESFCYAKLFGYDARDDGGKIWYRATDSGICEGPWKPSIHIPRWAARIFLKITGLRDEIVQDISEEDAIAEGLKEYFWNAYAAKIPHIAKDIAEGKRWWNHFIIKRGRKSSVWDCPIKAYRELWDDINAKRHNGIYTWDKNPIVKVIEFKMQEVKDAT